MAHYLYVIKLSLRRDGSWEVIDGPDKVHSSTWDTMRTDRLPHGQRYKAWKVTDKDSPKEYEAQFGEQERHWYTEEVRKSIQSLSGQLGS